LGRVGAAASEGFTIDIEEAKALGNIQRRVGTLVRKRYAPRKNGGPLTAAEIAEDSELRALISKRSAALVCPPGYGPQDAMEDSNRLHQLNCKRLSPPSCGGGELKGAEDGPARWRNVMSRFLTTAKFALGVVIAAGDRVDTMVNLLFFADIQMIHQRSACRSEATEGVLQ
jgi:hypothetical protein